MNTAVSPAQEQKTTERPSLLARLNPFLPLIQAVLIVLIGYVLKDRLDQAIRERETTVKERLATVENLNKMAELLKKINESGTDEIARSQATAQLSMYGSDAVFPLFVMAAARSPTPPTEAINGLRLLAVQLPEQVCGVLLSAQRVPKALNEIRRQSIADLTKELGCLPPSVK